jgi:hypothetical protein
VFRSDRVALSDEAEVVGELQYVEESQCFTLIMGQGVAVPVVWPPDTEPAEGNDVGVVLPGGTVYTVGDELRAVGGYRKFGVDDGGGDVPEGFEECVEEGEEFAVIDSAGE